jgi:hypothetical protein
MFAIVVIGDGSGGEETDSEDVGANEAEEDSEDGEHGKNEEKDSEDQMVVGR